MQNAMCIGGPKDGECVLIDDNRDWFHIAVYPPMNSCWPVGEIAADEVISVKRVTYTRRNLLGVRIWAVDCMRDPDIINLLYMRYFHGDAGKTR